MSDPHHQDDQITVWHGDCLDVLRKMPDNSVASVVTDPPYGLEFMGKEWDAFKQRDARTAGRSGAGAVTGGAGLSNDLSSPRGRSRVSYGAQRSMTLQCDTCQVRSPIDRKHSSKFPDCDGNWVSVPMYPNAPAPLKPFQDWCELWAAECLRVLKPGGHLLAFGGTRTWHRLACAVEDAGFEMRDSIAWMYGCHDDQTEVLTRRGWVNGLDLTPDDDVAQWSTDGTISLVRPSARQRYAYDGRLVRFRNADVDQLVTPNHRVYRQVLNRQQIAGDRVSTWSDWQIDQAGDINRWQQMRLPAAGIHNGSGIGGEDYAALLGWVWAEGGFDPSGTGVRVHQSSTNQPLVDEIAALFDRLGAHKRYDYQRQWKGNSYTATTWYISGDLAQRVRTDLPGKSPTYELLWCMTEREKRAMWDAAMKGDGSKGQRAFWQKDRADLEWAQALLAGIGYRGKIAEDPRGVIHWTYRPTVELQARHLQDEGEDYFGEVWCVTVPSGAFIVRRCGRVSVSGNSGFPKSLDVSKAIDKAAGAEREVIGQKTSPFTHQPSALMSRGSQAAQGYRPDGEGYAIDRRQTVGEYGKVDITAPATEAAQQWQGWGTALKPAFEPIVVARKPLTGTVAQNVTTWGTGALNIEGCRIGTESTQRKSGSGDFGIVNDDGWKPDVGRVMGSAAGRWPANVVLDESQAEALDQQSGVSTSTAALRRNAALEGSVYAVQTERITTGHADTGGASRFFYTAKAGKSERPVGVDGTAHPTVKPLALMRWLVRLVTPPGGVCLEPFAGSGTTVEATLLEGFRCVAIEREADYLPLIAHRIARAEAAVQAQIDTAASAPLSLFDAEEE